MDQRERVRLLRTRVFDVVSASLALPSGREQRLSIVQHPGAVAILPRLDNGDILLVRQYRAAVGAWTLEIPAGRLECGEDPRAAAERELEEETRRRALRWTLLRSFWPAPGFCSEVVHLFLAEGLTDLAEKARAPDADEEIEIVQRPPGACLDESHDAKTLLAVYWLLNAPDSGLGLERAP